MDKRTLSQINNIIINQKWRRSLQYWGEQQSQPSYWKYSPKNTKKKSSTKKDSPVSMWVNSEIHKNVEISGNNKPYSVLEDEQELDIVAFNKVLINVSDKFWDTRKKMD